MHPIVLCPSCGANIGSVLAVFYRLKLAAIREHTEAQRIMHEEINYGAIARELGYTDMCCYANLVSIRMISDYGIGMPIITSFDKTPYLDGQ